MPPRFFSFSEFIFGGVHGRWHFFIKLDTQPLQDRWRRAPLGHLSAFMFAAVEFHA